MILPTCITLLLYKYSALMGDHNPPLQYTCKSYYNDYQVYLETCTYWPIQVDLKTCDTKGKKS